MRLRVGAMAAALGLCLGSAALAQETPEMGPPEPSAAVAAPAPVVLPQVPAPPAKIPTPVAPSELPTDYIPLPIPPIKILPVDFIEVNADQVRTTLEEGKPVLTTATGNVTARYHDVTITAQRGTVDYKANQAAFEGDVVFRIGALESHGERAALDMRTGRWTFTQATATIYPDFAKGYLRAPVFSSALEAEGVKQQEANLTTAEATTCNLDRPHYELVSRTVSVYPNRKIVFRGMSFYALDKKIISFRSFVVPLRDIERNTKLIPNIGQTAEEGAFLKIAYPFLGTKSQTGTVGLDLMTRKGIGQEVNYAYQFGEAVGSVRLNHILDQNTSQDTFDGLFRHSQPLGMLNLNVSSEFRTNDYRYAAQSSTLINQATLTRNRGAENTSLVVNQTVNDTFQRTTRIAGNLDHSQRLGGNILWDSSFDYTSFTLTESTARLTSQMAFSRKEKKFDWSLSAQQIANLSDEAFVGGGRFAGIERLPELALTSDTARLGNILPLGIPARLRLAYGRYVELPATTNLGRTYFAFETPPQRLPLSHTWTFTTGAGFHQYLYSDNTAQYSVDTTADLRKSLGKDSSLAFTYRYQQPQGFTPFRFDFVGRYNVANASLNIQENQQFRLSLLTGYSWENKDFPWQDLTLRWSYQPNNSYLLYTATGYDANRSRWRTLINQVRVRAGESFKLDIGTRYDTIRKQLATAKLQLDARVADKTRVEALAGYNGFTGAFDYRAVKLTRDLHCWEASLIYVDQGGFYTNSGLQFFVRIKAFPLFENFGMGSFGQALDTSVGQVY